MKMRQWESTQSQEHFLKYSSLREVVEKLKDAGKKIETENFLHGNRMSYQAACGL